MAVILKSRQEIALLREAGRLVAQTYEVLRPSIRPGVSTWELDQIAEDYIRGQGGIPVYKGYGARPAYVDRPAVPPFPATICVALNDVICHGIPSKEEILQEGDIIGIDIGARFKGWVGDSCVTFPVGEIDAESQRLLDVTRQCLNLGIEQARVGNYFGDIGAAIQTYAEAQGFSVVRELIGHGVGRTVHEPDPQVFHYGKARTGGKIRPGMVFTIEPMINVGVPGIMGHDDRWRISTADGKRSAQFEHSLAVTESGCEILTQL